MLMEQTIIVLLALLGLCMGSFAGATVWRLRARQLVQDKTEGEEVEEGEYKKLQPLTQSKLTSDHSRCLHCGHELKWYDLIPLVSWASTGGRCRYCHKKIGAFEPLIELGVGGFFVVSYLLWPISLDTPLGIFQFVLWLASGVLLAILFAYDFKWFLLPNRIVFPLIGVSAVLAVSRLVGESDLTASLIEVVLSVSILSGLYFILWVYSKGKWIGFGDVKLGLALALLLGDWQLAALALFLANLLGCLLVLPGMFMGKITRGTHVPFGPLLIGGSVIAALFGQPVLQWYFSVFL